GPRDRDCRPWSRADARAGRVGRLLRRGRVADKCRQARERQARDGVARAPRGQARGAGRRRRPRWREPGRRRAEGPARPGRGARWDAGRREPGRRPDDAARGAAMRVVIAEDLALLRDGLTRLLESNDCTVVAAVADGDAFLEAAEEHRPDVCVVDVRLPPTFRDEGVRAALEARRRVPGLPILVL